MTLQISRWTFSNEPSTALRKEGTLVVTRHYVCSSKENTYDDIIGANIEESRSQDGSVTVSVEEHLNEIAIILNVIYGVVESVSGGLFEL